MTDWAVRLREMSAEDRDALREALEDYDYDFAPDVGAWPANTTTVEALTVPNVWIDLKAD